MKRFQLGEFCDQNWLPPLLREAYHDCLGFIHRAYRPFNACAKNLRGSAECGEPLVYLDLASGSGEHVATLFRAAQDSRHERTRLPKFVLSDLYPLEPDWKLLRQEWGEDRLDYIGTPVSVAHVPAAVSRNWTIFSAFHHLSPPLARQFMMEVSQKANVMHIAEESRRNWSNLVSVILVVPTFLLAPFFARRFSLAKLCVTTLVPIVPLMMLADGIVSCLRSYRPDEIIALLPEDARDRFRVEWHEPRVAFTPFRITFFSLYRIRPLPDIV